MTIEPIGAITLLLGLLGLFVEESFIVYVFFGTTLLGAAGAIILDSLGGTTIQPAHLLLGFVMIKLLGNREVRSGMRHAVVFGTPGFWFLLTAIYATLTAYFMPRLFYGETFTFVVRAQGENHAVPLAPTTSNLTQSIYFIGNCACFLILAGYGGSERGRNTLARAGLMCVMLNLAFAVIDLVTYATNTGDLMAFIRNSTYSMLSDRELAGFKRIVGSFVEASSFGYATLGYFAFTSTLWLRGVAPKMTLLLSSLSLLALLFSTSTTAYVGLAIYVFVEFGLLSYKLLLRPSRPEVIFVIFGLPFILALIVVMICLNDPVYAYVTDLLDTLVLNKMSTSSGVERSNWNSQAFQNFLDTYGFGVGNGSVRASSFLVAAISSLGVLGATCYALFLLSIWFQAREPEPEHITHIQSAARSACLAWLIAASTSGGFIDLGLSFSAFAALGSVKLLSPRNSSAALEGLSATECAPPLAR